MREKINVGVSNRHVHLTKEVYERLFSVPIFKKNDLHQISEFASNQVVTIKTDKNCISNVRVIGPFREYNQVEIMRSDAYKLGINPPVRKSGDLKISETVTLVGDKGEVTLENCCIIADRHVHMNLEKAHELGVKEDQKVKINVVGDKAGVLFAHIKISENGFYELHIDFDDANAFGLKNGDEVEIIY